MNNFTKSNGKSYWHAITNLTCCNIDFRKWQMSSMKATMVFMLFAFSISMSAQINDTRSVFYPVCWEDRPGAPFTEEEIADLYENQCASQGEAPTVVLTETPGNTSDCAWDTIYEYDVKCGDFEDTVKFVYEGGDINPPVLEGEIPSGATGLNLCYNEIPSGPSEAEIAALYSEDCSQAIVTKSGQPSGNDCDWSVTYTYTIVDECGNESEPVNITYSGGDDEAPELAKGAVLPEGETGLNLCYDDRPSGPSEAEIAALFVDNCGDVIVTRSLFFKGDDCGWKGEVVYTIQDECGNAYPDLVLSYNGGDQEAPVLDVLPEDFTVSCIDQIPSAQSINFSDNCTEGKNKAEATDDTSGLGIACEGGIVIRTWTATDDCGNSTSHSITITVEPAPEAEFDTPQDITINCDDLDTFEPGFLAYDNGAQGACNISGEVQGVAQEFTGPGCGQFEVDYEFTDECGRTITAKQIVTVEDTTPPQIETAKDLTVECDGQGNIAEYEAWLANNADATGTDNCGDVTWTYEVVVDNPGCGATHVYEVVFTASDDCGNSVATKGVFTIEDNTPPSITPAIDETVECDGQGNQGDYQAWLDNNGGATASDDCSDVTWSYTEEITPGCGATLQAFVTFTATDDCGLSSSTSATFTVQDTTDPMIDMEAMDMTVECDGEGNQQALADWLANNGGATASDDCGDVTWSNNFEALSDDCGATGSATVEFTATDECGNESKTSATFTIVDTASPPITNAAEDLTVECDGQGNIEELNAWLANNANASAYDICSEVTWSNNFDSQSFSDGCGLTGSIEVLFTVTDECGLSSSTAAIFTIQDTTPPSITEAVDATVECDGAGNQADLDAWLADNGGATASDVCGDVTWSNNFSGLSDDCGATGSATVEFTATDECGNESKTSATFTIQDTTDPALSAEAQDYVAECDGAGNQQELDNWLNTNGGAMASDICGDVTWTNNFAGLSDDCGATGSATVEFTATDECGNETKTSATFTIQDTTPPSIDVAPMDLTVECGPNNEGEYIEWLNNNAGGQGSDACGTATWSNIPGQFVGDCGATGYIDVEFILTDECGLESKASARFTVIDTTPPSIDLEAQDLTVECDGQGNQAQLDEWLASNGGAQASDNCGTVSWSNDFAGLTDDCGATGSATVEFTVTDECGLTNKTVATFTIVDTTPPAIEGGADYTAECDGAGNAAELQNWLDTNAGATASDECSDVTWSNDFTALSDDCGATGSATVTFTATDDCGLSSSVTYTFTIQDTNNPSIDVEAMNETVECDGAGNAAELQAWLDSNGGAEASDLCGSVSWTNDFTGLSDDCGATGSALVVFTAEDECGNTSKTSATFTIEDTTPPSIDVEAADETVECDGAGNQAQLDAWLAANGGASASDICGNVTWSNNYDALSDDCGATGSATVEFTATDECGNESKTSATFTIVDTTPPTVDVDPSDLKVECDGNGNQEEFANWLATFGGGQASDTCGDVTWSHNCTNGESVTYDFNGQVLDPFASIGPADANGGFALMNTVGGESDATIEAFLGIAPGTLDGLNGTDLDNGSAISLPISVNAGDTISFDWDFTTEESIDSFFNDTAFVLLVEDGLVVLADTFDVGPAGFDTFNYQFAAGGNCVLAYGVLNGEDGLFNSTLSIDNININGGGCELTDECGATGSVTVEFTATDDCGNETKRSATFTIEDTISPKLDTDAEDLTVECDGEGNQVDLQTWLDNNGGATASDDCSEVTWTNNFTGLSDLCGATGSATVEFTATDDCGNDVKTSATFTIVDTTPPAIEGGADETVECDGAGNIDALNAWLDSNAGATASDECSAVTWSNDFTALSDDCGATGSATVTFTATDDCGLSSSVTYTFTIEDTTPPSIDTEASDLTVECDGAGNIDEFNAWVANNGGAVASDTCGDVTWSNNCDNPWIGFMNVFELDGTSFIFGGGWGVPDLVTIVSNDNTSLTLKPNRIGDPDPFWQTGDLFGNKVMEANTFVLDDTLLGVPFTFNANVDSNTLDPEYSAEAFIKVFNADYSALELFITQPLNAGPISLEYDGSVAPAGGHVQYGFVVKGRNANFAPEFDAAYEALGNIQITAAECVVSDECGATGSRTVVFTATDECGNISQTSATFTIEDTTPPTIDVPPADLTVECDGNGNIADLENWLNTYAGAQGSDACGDVTWSYECPNAPPPAEANGKSAQGGPSCVLSDECGATGSVTVEFTLTDECGNSVKDTATFTIVDTTPPSIDTPPADLTVECDGEGNQAQLEEWLATYGGAIGSDQCGDATWSYECPNGTQGGGNYIDQILTSPADFSGGETLITFEELGLADLNITNEYAGSGVIFSNNTHYDQSPFSGDAGLGSISGTGLINNFGAPNSGGPMQLNFVSHQNRAGFYIATNGGDTTIEVACISGGNVVGTEVFTLGSQQYDFIGIESATGFDQLIITSPDFFLLDDLRFEGGSNLCVLSDECGATGSVTVEFTLTDECGNESKASATFTIEDTTPPTIDTPAADETVECDGEGNQAQLAEWLANNGGASASDQCGDVTWSNNFTALSDDCGATGSAMVEFTATDECGNESKTTATFTIEDTTNPTLDQPAADLTVECDGAGNVADLQAWLDSNGGAMASDICSDVTWSHNFTGLSDDCAATGSATVEFTATDDCGNDVKTSATFTIEDTIAPELVGEIPPSINDINACYDEMPTPPSEADIAALFYEACGEVVVSLWSSPVGDDCGWSVIHVYSVEDECGNVYGDVKVYYSGADETKPELIGVPADVTVECDNVPDPADVTATDNCDDQIAVEYGQQIVPVGPCESNYDIFRTWSATDACGNSTSETQVIQVRDTIGPSLKPDAELPTGENQINDCKPDPETSDLWPSADQIAQLYEDNCGTVNVQVTVNCNGDDCKWIVDVLYEVYDDCGNLGDSFKLWYHGEDLDAPTYTLDDAGAALCANETVEIRTSEGGACPADADTSLIVGTIYPITENFLVAGLPVQNYASLIECFEDDCAKASDLRFEVMDIQLPSDCPNNQLVITLDILDPCDNRLEGFVCTFLIIDDEAPVLDCPAGDDLGYNPNTDPATGIPYGLVDKVPYTDNCDADGMTSVYTDDLQSTFREDDDIDGFTGDFAQANWTVDTGTSDGYVTINPGQMTVVGSDNGSVSNVTALATCPISGEYTFDWVFTTQDGPGWDAGFYVNGVLAIELGDANGDFGSVTVNCAAGDVIGFGVSSVDGIFGAGQLDITNFTVIGGCYNDYTLTRTFTHTDLCGNEASCDVVYTWSEQVDCPPLLVCGDIVNSNTSTNGELNDNAYCDTDTNTAPGMWYTFIGTGETVTVSTCSANTSYDTKLAVFTDYGITCVGGQDDQFSCSHSWLHSEVTFASVLNQEYKIYVSGWASAAGDFELSVSCGTPPPTAAPQSMEDSIELDFTAYPVPFDKEVTIKYNFEFDSDVTIQVFDTKGLLLYTETNRSARANTDHRSKIDLSRGGDQVFYVTVNTKMGAVTKKIVSSTLKRR